LAGESSYEESVEDRSEDRATAGCRSPRSGPSAVRFGDFLSPAWQRVEAAKLGAAGRRRKKFAPGDHGARLFWEIRPGGARSAAVLVPAAVAQAVEEDFPPLVPSIPPVVVVSAVLPTGPASSSPAGGGAAAVGPIQED
jgi:hypothetical protein